MDTWSYAAGVVSALICTALVVAIELPFFRAAIRNAERRAMWEDECVRARADRRPPPAPTNRLTVG